MRRIGLDGFSALCMLLLAAGCGGGQSSKVVPMEIDADAGEKAVAQLDANKDGKLDYNELAKAPGLRDGMAKIKKIDDPRNPTATAQLKKESIAADEINGRIKEWKAQGTGRMAVTCRVMHLTKPGDKKSAAPLAKAHVKFVPESFQGAALTPGSGDTDEAGVASIAQPSRGADDPAEGMSPGFYRIEVTKGSEIPAKYNTATTLGAEVAADSLRITTGGIVVELEY